MSDIDRIAEKYYSIFIDNQNLESVDDLIRAALLEYGAIVREECANVCDPPYMSMDEYLRIQNHIVKREVDLERNIQTGLAAAIRRMNAHQG